MSLIIGKSFAMIANEYDYEIYANFVGYYRFIYIHVCFHKESFLSIFFYTNTRARASISLTLSLPQLAKAWKGEENSQRCYERNLY